MQTTVTKKITPEVMDAVFDRRDLVNIRLCQPKGKSSFEIVIRHNEDEDPNKLLNDAIKAVTA